MSADLAMVAVQHFIAHEKLGAKDIAELRKQLDTLEKKEH